MVKKEIAVKKYVVKLSGEERERLEAMVRAGKGSAQILTRARILLKADVSEAGDGWSDSAISAEWESRPYAVSYSFMASSNSPSCSRRLPTMKW